MPKYQCHIQGSCPFSGTDSSEQAQNYGCLPSPYEIVQMAVKHGRKWACHDNPEKPCKGAIQHIAEQKIDVTYIDAPLVTELDNWGALV